MTTDKTTAHLAMWAKALMVHGATTGACQLGDRTTYIGMSDIGRGIECLRAAVVNKLYAFARPNEVEQICSSGDIKQIMEILKSEITRQRGHWIEAGMVTALSDLKVPFLYQLEIRAIHNTVPIYAHLDVTLVGRHRIRIIELKSTKRLRESLFVSHETQLFGQIGLLKALWNRPAFGVKNVLGDLIHHDCTFPELVARMFNIVLPENVERMDIEGWVVSVAPDDIRLYGPYLPHSAPLKAALETADAIWYWVTEIRAGRATLSQVPYNNAFHPLCDWCGHNSSCPKFTGPRMDEYASVLQEKLSLRDQIRALDADAAELDAHLKAAYRRLVENQNIRSGEWVIAGDNRFRVIASGNSERLYIGPVNPEPPAPQNTHEISNMDQAEAA